MEIDYGELGLQFILVRKRIEMNWHLAEHRAETEGEDTSASLEFGCFGISRLPGGLLRVGCGLGNASIDHVEGFC